VAAAAVLELQNENDFRCRQFYGETSGRRTTLIKDEIAVLNGNENVKCDKTHLTIAFASALRFSPQPITYPRGRT
jgi:hypothetical protein